MNSNLKSLLQTLRHHELKFFNELEKKYFKKAKNLNSSNNENSEDIENSKVSYNQDMPLAITSESILQVNYGTLSQNDEVKRQSYAMGGSGISPVIPINEDSQNFINNKSFSKNQTCFNLKDYFKTIKCDSDNFNNED